MQQGREGDRGVDVALAEYAALRAEVVNAQTIQSAVVGVGLAGVGLIGTAGLQHDGDPRLLVVIPPLSLIICLLHLAESYRLFRVGDYIRDSLWPYLNEQSTYPHSWELRQSELGRRWSGRFVVVGIVVDGLVPLMFALLGAAAILVSETSERPLVVVGWLSVGLTLLIPVVFARARMRANRLALAHRHPEEATRRRGGPAASE